jgi:hypothetical protein
VGNPYATVQLRVGILRPDVVTQQTLAHTNVTDPEATLKTWLPCTKVKVQFLVNAVHPKLCRTLCIDGLPRHIEFIV